MPVGVLVNVASVAIGGILGALLSSRISNKVKETLNLMFSLCAMSMGIVSIILMQNMPAVILSVLIGSTIGVLIHLGDLIVKAGSLMQKPIAKLFGSTKEGMDETQFLSSLVTIIVLFCCSGTGIYGCIDSGMTGDHTILIAKSILDLFTAMIFACNLGLVVSVISIPQLIIFLTLFFLAKFIYPLTTPAMIGDFKACGGILLLATSFRMMKVREFPIADMIPAMIIVMPVSWLWATYIVPIL